MEFPLDEVVACVRQKVEPSSAFNALREIGKARFKSPLWDAPPPFSLLGVLVPLW
jgi:hypothetical protein